jgi:hypothetical protein
MAGRTEDYRGTIHVPLVILTGAAGPVSLYHQPFLPGRAFDWNMTETARVCPAFTEGAACAYPRGELVFDFGDDVAARHLCIANFRGNLVTLSVKYAF